MLDFVALTQQCAPTVDPQTMAAIIKVESNNNPYAIGVVGGRLVRQPINHAEAVATAKQLAAEGWNFSIGLTQLNRVHLSNNKLTYDQAFDACTNLHVGSKILEQCYRQALQQGSEPQMALQRAFSCYYSGNFWQGFQSEGLNKPSYVQKVFASAGVTSKAIPVVLALQTDTDLKRLPDEERASQNSAELPSDNTPLLLPPANKTDNPVAWPHLLTTDTNEETNNPLPLEKVEQHRTVLVF